MARFGPWLFRIAHNETYSHFRKRRPEIDNGDETLIEREPARGPAPDLTIAVTSALDRLTGLSLLAQAPHQNGQFAEGRSI